MRYRGALRGAAVLLLITATGGMPSATAQETRDPVVRTLVDLLRIDTTNSPGDTRKLAEYLKGRFDRAGIPNEIILAPNGKAAHFIARLKGNGSKRPLLLAAHTDVVPADRARWSVDPFAGVIKDGFLWGRGALDNKGAVAAFAEAVLRIKADKVPLDRDIILLAEADEEQGTFNTNWLAANHWDKIDAEFALNEGGAIQWSGGKVYRANVSYADKLTVNIRIRAEGPAGHSSRPLPTGQSANDQLVAALERLVRYREPVSLSSAGRRYFETLAKLNPGSHADAIRRLLTASDQAALDAAAVDVIREGDRAGGWGTEGLLRNTVALTMLSSGLKPNIIPGTAEAVVNARLMPGTDLDAFLGRLRSAIGNDRIKLEVFGSNPNEDRAARVRVQAAIKPSPIDTSLYTAIEESVAATWPGAAVLPTLLVASTDATPWRERGVPVYGIAPFPTQAEDSARVHGDDERVSLTAIEQGSRYVHRLLIAAAAKSGLPRGSRR